MQHNLTVNSISKHVQICVPSSKTLPIDRTLYDPIIDLILVKAVLNFVQASPENMILLSIQVRTQDVKIAPLNINNH